MDRNVVTVLEPWVEKTDFFRSYGLDLGIVNRYKESLKKDGQAKDLDKGDLNLVFEAAKKGEVRAASVVEEACTRFGLKVAYLTNFFNPEVVVLGGGIERGGELVLNVVRRVVKQLVMEESSGVVKIILSRLGEDAVAYGAVCLVTQELFAEV